MWRWGKTISNLQPSVCCKCSFGLRWQLKQPQHMSCQSYAPHTIQRQLVLLAGCHHWSGSSSKEYLSSWNEGCHLAVLLITEQQVSDTCQNKVWGGGHDATLQLPSNIHNSLDGNNELHCTRGGCSFKLSQLPVVASSLSFAVMGNKGNSTVKDVRNYANKPSGKKISYCLIVNIKHIN